MMLRVEVWKKIFYFRSGNGGFEMKLEREMTAEEFNALISSAFHPSAVYEVPSGSRVGFREGPGARDNKEEAEARWRAQRVEPEKEKKRGRVWGRYLSH